MTLVLIKLPVCPRLKDDHSGRLVEHPTQTINFMRSTVILILHSLVTVSVTVTSFGPSPVIHQVCKSPTMHIKEQVPLIAETASTNLLSITMAGISGAIGFGTARGVCHQSEGNATLFRTGENHLKKARCLNKPRKLSCQSQSVKFQPIWVPPDDCCECMCQNLQQHNCFGSVLQPSCYSAPLTRCIHHVKKEIFDLCAETCCVECFLAHP